eukprot:3975386-Prymnesium_polylepis.1
MPYGTEYWRAGSARERADADTGTRGGVGWHAARERAAGVRGGSGQRAGSKGPRAGGGQGAIRATGRQ